MTADAARYINEHKSTAGLFLEGLLIFFFRSGYFQIVYISVLFDHNGK